MCTVRNTIRKIAQGCVKPLYKISSTDPNRKAQLKAWMASKRYIYPGKVNVRALQCSQCDAHAIQTRPNGDKAFLHPAIASVIEQLLWTSRRSFLDHIDGFFDLEIDGTAVKRIPPALVGLAATAVRIIFLSVALLMPSRFTLSSMTSILPSPRGASSSSLRPITVKCTLSL